MAGLFLKVSGLRSSLSGSRKRRRELGASWREMILRGLKQVGQVADNPLILFCGRILGGPN